EGAEITVTADTEVQAVWEDIPVVTYTVTFDANGGTGTMADVTEVSGTYTLPSNGFTAPEGKQFKCWSVDGEEKAEGAEIIVTADTEVQAVWEDIPVVTYTVTFDANGGTGTMASVEVNEGESFTFPENGFTAPEGKKFAGWDMEGYGVYQPGETRESITSNVNVKANWEEDVVTPTTYEVAVTNGTTDKEEAEEGETVTITANAPDTGKEFDKWEVVSGGITLADETSATTTFTMGTAKVEVTAKYKDEVIVTPTTYEVAVTNGTTDKEEAEEGETVTITANVPDTGKEFDKWEVVSGGITLADETSATTTFTMGTAKVEVTAKYKDKEEVIVTPTTYEVTFNTDGGSEVVAQTVEEGKTAIKPTNPTKSGYTFKEWQKDGVTFDFTTAITGDIELKALWTKNETKPTSGGGGGGSSSSSYKVTTKMENGTITPANASVKKNAVQEFTFKANDGYEITDVLVDGKSVGAVESYKLEKVTSKHTIEVKTAKKSILSNVDDWAKEEMTKAEEKGLIPETFEKKDGTKTIDRTDFAAVAVKLYEAISGKKAEPVSTNPFTDTNNEYVLKAYNLGITLGTSETTFTPDAEITREQMATMLTRALNKVGIDVAVDLENATRFADDSDLSDWGRASVYFMAKEEIIKGVGNNRFNGLGNAKIEEAIAMALRSVDKFSRAK
ncbi:MAG: InlB B-repeat-containing protein, partial [Clostridia bacterium]|nr:InlB B-repeat-containing protein [Clostridia bacterium]